MLLRLAPTPCSGQGARDPAARACCCLLLALPLPSHPAPLTRCHAPPDRRVGPFLGAVAAVPLHLFFASAYDTVPPRQRDPLALDDSGGSQAGGTGRQRGGRGDGRARRRQLLAPL